MSIDNSNTDQNNKNGGGEKSVNEILGSIRGVMNDEQATPPANDEADSKEDDEALELTEVTGKEDSKALELTEEVKTEEALELTEMAKTDEVLELTEEARKEMEVKAPEPTEATEEAIPTEAPAAKTSEGHVEMINGVPVNTTEAAPTLKQSDAIAAPAVEHQEAKKEEEKQLEDKQEDKTMLDDKVNLSPAAEEETSITEDSKKHAESMLSQNVAHQTSAALKDLVKKTSQPVTDGLHFRSGLMVEDLVIEAMKPYMKEWLDNNLPNIVKKLVEKEIRKLIPRDDD